MLKASLRVSLLQLVSRSLCVGRESESRGVVTCIGHVLLCGDVCGEVPWCAGRLFVCAILYGLLC